MEVNEKTSTLKTVFFKYIITLGIAFIVVLGVLVGIAALFTQKGLIFEASYSEDQARGVKPMLSSSKEITESMIPSGCKYAVFNKKYEVVKTDLQGKDLLEAEKYAKGTYNPSGSSKNYYFIERQDGFCILQYYVRTTYKSEILNRYFPSPEAIMFITLGFVYLLIVFIVTTIYAKSLKIHLEPLFEATQKIKEQNLNFEVKHSGIKEFNDVLLSIQDMKTELKKSLEQQWNVEQAKKEQISALAHDIKTPLTIIKGNADLLGDSPLNNEQQEYAYYISKNACQMEQYIKTLIEISNSEKTISLKLESIALESFVSKIKSQLEALAKTKGLVVEFIQADLPSKIIVDEALMHRAIMNVISNAIDYSPEKGKVSFEVRSQKNKVIFRITDSGKGFSQGDIKSASKQFYMGDKSRASKTHYGMGLYITESIIKLHGGALHIANSPVTGGAEVTMEIKF